MINSKEQRIEIFEDTMKLCKGNPRLAEAVKKSISGRNSMPLTVKFPCPVVKIGTQKFP